ncbi:microtubule-associated protein 60 isoform 2-T2 [Cochliomyia hominivorax]
MPIQLDKILGDIANEKVLHPNYQGASKKEIDDAWTRVGKNSSLSVHESRSIFKVLQKKYEQEKLKESSAWKLFGLMDQIHKKVEEKDETKEEEPNVPMEEDEEYEMLEVQEEEDNGQPGHSGESASEGESPIKTHNNTASPEKEDKPVAKTLSRQQTTPTSNAHHQDHKTPSTKLLNSLAANTPKNSTTMATPQTPSATAAALQKKGITMKKTGNQQNRSLINQNVKNQQVRTAANAGAMHGLEVGKTIQLPDSLKRKLSEDQPMTPQTKKANQQSTPQSNNASPSAKSASPQRQQNQQHTTTAQLLQLKQDRNDQQSAAASNNTNNTAGINLITIPANPSATGLVNGLISTGGGGPSSSTAATVASTASTNGFSPRIEDIDFRNDIIFDANNGVNGTALTGKVTNTSEIINLGNFDNSLPPTFFKNLCNSSRHEALGLYVANVMNRLRPRSAAKLEVGILRAILDIQSEELEQ